ncbi:MAG: type II secretion system protein [Acidimicrobiia bacterium]
MRSRRHAATDEGFTLIEVLIAVALLGAGAVTGLAALATLSSSSSLSRDTSQARALLSSAAQAVVDQGRNPYDADCDATYDPLAGGTVTLPSSPVVWPSSSVAISVEYWNGTGFGTTCYDVANPFARMQRITVTVHSPDNRVSEQVTVLKRGE